MIRLARTKAGIQSIINLILFNLKKIIKKIIKKINDTSDNVDTLNKKVFMYVEVFLYENL